ncbi:diphthine synthase, partial [Candidatus Bathyarchaeota archaeon]|nr:diphthine synthase [Candidatus Bathyarchaeota archaeon]
YTSLMIGLRIKNLELLIKDKIVLLTRQSLEEQDGERILTEAKKGKTVFLVPGDPMIATTHVDLRIRAERNGIRTRVIHGASITSAAIALSGLQNYKFGRSVTVPFNGNCPVSETPYNVIKMNMRAGLHTLCFLDLRVEEDQYMHVQEALQILFSIEDTKHESVITDKTLVVGIARAGSKNPTVKAGLFNEVLEFKFGGPPHILIFPGKLHFVEVEALVTLAHAPDIIGGWVK